MHAIILAGGHATRLWPLTRHRAKPLLPLGGKPIIGYLLEELAGIDAVDEVLISTNAKYADDFRAFLDQYGYEARVVVEDHEREEDKLGSLGAMMQVMEQKGSGDFLVIGGDNYAALDLQTFLSFAREKDCVTNACFELADGDATQYGIVDIDDGNRIQGFVEKPDEPPSRLVSTACYYFPERQQDIFDQYVAAHGAGKALDEPGRLLAWAHDRYELYAYPFTGGWYDIGTPEQYLAAQRAVGDGANQGTVTDSSLGENVWVMDGAEVVGSELEDCIVFPDARISDATVKHSIIDEEAVLSGVSLDGAVIGAFSRVQ